MEFTQLYIFLRLLVYWYILRVLKVASQILVVNHLSTYDDYLTFLLTYEHLT